MLFLVTFFLIKSTEALQSLATNSTASIFKKLKHLDTQTGTTGYISLKLVILLNHL